ncbi:hypothetical protein [Thetidibacter halocola]|uniref:Uncharacterized protein n=1 Tax=Thetidibacter halocola TaxID=2827239 RepID=A0A8J7W7Z3_9RHOB|nr:hypothetical protein [Thetidibacter halocola]MBS0122587.1 hypothetical protein [Thetidibacter halocola]
MAFQTFVTLAALGLAGTLAPQEAPGTTFTQAPPFIDAQGMAPGPVAGDYRTTPEGCTYRRTQAPGYPERWILIVNPQQLGLPRPPSGCPGMM